MIKLKKIIKESFGDRKFGEPLPTFSSVMKNHQLGKVYTDKDRPPFQVKEETINEENESAWTWIYKGLLGGWKKAEKKGGNRVEEVAVAAAFLIKTEYGSGAKKDFLKEFNRRIK